MAADSASGPDGGMGPMFDQEPVHAIYREWRTLTDTYGADRILVAEACVQPPERAARYVRPDEMHHAFNFQYSEARWSAPSIRFAIEESLRVNDAVGAPTTWVTSNHDLVRIASRLGLKDPGVFVGGIGPRDPQPDAIVGLRRARASAMVTLALPGSAYLYQGEELGLPEHTTLLDSDRQDPTFRRSGGSRLGRDGCRVPLPWDASSPAYGFSPTGQSWLPQPQTWADYAVDRQSRDAASTLALYRRLITLRRKLRLGTGALVWPDHLNEIENVLAFRTDDVLVVVNFTAQPVVVPANGQVIAISAIETAPTVPLRSGIEVPAHGAVWVRAGTPHTETK